MHGRCYSLFQIDFSILDLKSYNSYLLHVGILLQWKFENCVSLFPLNIFPCLCKKHFNDKRIKTFMFLKKIPCAFLFLKCNVMKLQTYNKTCFNFCGGKQKFFNLILVGENETKGVVGQLMLMLHFCQKTVFSSKFL